MAIEGHSFDYESQWEPARNGMELDSPWEPLGRGMALSAPVAPIDVTRQHREQQMARHLPTNREIRALVATWNQAISDLAALEHSGVVGARLDAARRAEGDAHNAVFKALVERHNAGDPVVALKLSRAVAEGLANLPDESSAPALAHSPSAAAPLYEDMARRYNEGLSDNPLLDTAKKMHGTELSRSTDGANGLPYRSMAERYNASHPDEPMELSGQSGGNITTPEGSNPLLETAKRMRGVG